MATPPTPSVLLRGFDAAAEEDLLGRWPLAKRVANTLTSAPATCSVRVGVFGRWGAGKSSVLNFVKQLVEPDGHVVVEFSPWGCTDSAQMWRAFMAAVVKGLAANGQNVKGAWKVSSKFSKTMDTVKKLGEARAESKAVVHALGPFVDEYLSFTANDLQAAAEALGDNRRLIVLVDDVDRTDPHVVPELLFGLRQLLDLRGLSWVLAIDPDLVGKALAVHHPGFGGPTEFLEKILEFMFWLPDPSPESLWRLAERDLQALQTGIDANIIRQELALLPDNPRSLRTFVRQLWSLKSELDRHAEDELDHRLLVFVILLRTQHVHLYEYLLKEEELLKDLSILWIHSRRDEQERRDQVLARVQKAVEETVPPRARTRAEALLRRLGEHQIWTPEHFKYHADLLDQPATVTRAEFRAALEAGDGLSSWLDGHAAQTRLKRSDVVSALFDQAVKAHEQFLQVGADAATEDEQKHNVAIVARILQLLERLGLEHGGFVGDRPALTEAQYRELVASISRWAHFTGSQYQAIREAEAALLGKFIEGATCDPLLFLNALSPWNARRLDDDDPDRVASRTLRARLAAVAETKAAPVLLDRLLQPGGVSAILGIAEQVAARYLLFRGASPLWLPPLRQSVGALLTTASPAVVENALDILSRLDTSGGRGVRDEIAVSELEKLAGDPEVVTWLWNAGTQKAPNIRRFSGLKELRTFLESKAGITLAEPTWWKRLEAEHAKLAPKVPKEGEPRNPPETTT